MCNFRAGQKVVAITPLAKSVYGTGVIHIADVLNCTCGCTYVTIQERPSLGKFTCVECKGIITRHSTHLGCRPLHFRPLIEDYTEEEIESVNIDELVEPEYEYA